VLDPYFSATKIEWLLENVDGLREQARFGRAAFGTIDAWLVFKLTGEYRTDVTNASRTMLFNIYDACWDDKLLAAVRVPREVLPQVRDSSEVYGLSAALYGECTLKDGRVEQENFDTYNVMRMDEMPAVQT